VKLKNYLCFYRMTKKYNQRTLVQRNKMEALLLAGKTQTASANILDVHRSTICREFKRNNPREGWNPGSTWLKRRMLKTSNDIAAKPNT
jgi:IS30 family transposase